MIHKQCLELVKISFHSKENVSRFKFFTASVYRKSFFKNMQPQCKLDRKDLIKR